jgi:enoyl-CoA hydratase/carnithine racemase
MWQALRRIGRDLPADVRVVVMAGEGRAFSAGLDLAALGTREPSLSSLSNETPPSNETPLPDETSDNFSLAALAQREPADIAEVIAGFQEGFAWLRRPDLFSIAAVRGHAIGAGFQLALACDLRVLADDAQLTMAEVALGLIPDLGGTKRLVELVGYSRALEICVTGRRIGAAEADRIGLAARVVPVAELDADVAELVAQVLAAPRDAVIEAKALIAAAAARPFAAQEEAERSAQVRRIKDLVGLGE